MAVERADSPASIATEPSALNFALAGDFCPVHVIGSYSDGTQTDITESLSTTFSSSDPTIATVSTTGMVTAVRPGTTQIVVNGSYSMPVTVRPPLIVLPPQKVLHAAQVQQFTARAEDPAMPGVLWSISPAGVGTIDSTGRYTAPTTIASLQVITITATNPADSGQQAAASVTLYPPLSVSVTPIAATLGPSQVQTFTATVQNAAYAGLIWSTDPSDAGTITNAGVYTAPASVSGQQNVTVTATSVADVTKTASAIVTLTPPRPVLASITPATGAQGTTVPVTLAGSNFVSGATVATNNAGITVSGVTVVSSTQITATFIIAANAPIGAANITVSTSGGTTAPGVFTIVAPLSITANSTSKTYGQTLTFAGTEFTPIGLIGSDSITSVTLTSSGAAVTAGVSGSPYSITPSAAVFGTGAVGNYNISYANGSLTVNPAPLTATVTGSQTYGGGNLTFTPLFATFANGDTSAVIGGTLSCTSNATSNSPAGNSYSVAGCSGLSATNYSINYALSTFTVYPAAGTISLTNLVQTYTGAGLSPTVVTNAGSYGTSGFPQTAPGIWQVSANTTDSNFTPASTAGTFYILTKVVVGVRTGQLTPGWTAFTGMNGGYDVTCYNVTDSIPCPTPLLHTTATSVTFTGLTNGKIYQLQVTPYVGGVAVPAAATVPVTASPKGL